MIYMAPSPSTERGNGGEVGEGWGKMTHPDQLS